MPVEQGPRAEAVLLVGGKGTRLRPLTLSAPKPMLPTAGVPFLRHLLSRLQEAGITHVVLGTAYQPEVFADYFGDGSRFGLEMEYVVEEEPLDTGGAIRNVAGSLREPDVLVFNGDILSGADPLSLLASHREKGADVTLHLVPVDDPSRFGCVPTEADGRVTAFMEKAADPPTDQVNAGCYVFRRPIINDIPSGRPVSVERETFPELLASGARVYGHVDASYWLDVGTPDAFVRASADLVRGIAPTAALPGEHGEMLALDGALIASTAVVDGGSTVGAGARVSHGAEVGGSVLLDGAVVEENAVIRDSVLGKRARVGAGAFLDGAVLGDGAHIGSACEFVPGVRIWPEVAVPDGGIRHSPDV